MPNSRNKKSIEKLHLEYFKERCREFPLNVEDDDDYGDKPDFLRKHSSGVLGVEHTRLFKVTNQPNAPQALESFRQEIVNSAQKCCERDIPPLLVKVWFYPNQVVPKRRKPEIKRISRALAGLIKKWHQENPSKFYETFRRASEMPAIFRMSITRAWNGKTGLPYHLWTVEAPAVAQNFTIEKVQSRINEKNGRYAEYLKKCDECWLLIVVDIFRDSQSFGNA
ncbi:MAG: hypothetical protein ACYSSN_12785 [Planctomycetota bacterium]|jgi:hypothetical protein